MSYLGLLIVVELDEAAKQSLPRRVVAPLGPTTTEGRSLWRYFVGELAGFKVQDLSSTDGVKWIFIPDDLSEAIQATFAKLRLSLRESTIEASLREQLEKECAALLEHPDFNIVEVYEFSREEEGPMLWYAPIEDTETINTNDSCALARGLFEAVHDVEGKRIHYSRLIVLNDEGEVVGCITREAAQHALDLRNGERTYPTVEEAMIHRRVMLEFDAEVPREEIQEALRDPQVYDRFHGTGEVVLLTKGKKVIGIATTYDIFIKEVVEK